MKRNYSMSLCFHVQRRFVWESKKNSCNVRSLNSKGNFLIASDLGMVWDTVSPFPSTMAVGRDFIIQTGLGGTKSKLDARGNETFISLADTISAIFSGNAEC